MGPLYRDIKTKKRFRVRFLKSLVNLLDRDSQSREATAPVDVAFGRFIVENLMYLDYGAIEEVHTVIHAIDRIMSSSGISLLQSYETGDKSESMDVLAHRSIVLSLLIGLKQNLKFSYNLTEAKCRAFDPKKAGGVKDSKTAVRVRQLGTYEWSDIPYLEAAPQDFSQMQGQLQAVSSP
jgi:cohesin loading factor subunit SCC2